MSQPCRNATLQYLALGAMLGLPRFSPRDITRLTGAPSQLVLQLIEEQLDSLRLAGAVGESVYEVEPLGIRLLGRKLENLFEVLPHEVQTLSYDARRLLDIRLDIAENALLAAVALGKNQPRGTHLLKTAENLLTVIRRKLDGVLPPSVIERLSQTEYLLGIVRESNDRFEITSPRPKQSSHWLSRDEFGQITDLYGIASSLEAERVWALFRGHPLLTLRRLFLIKVGDHARTLFTPDVVEFSFLSELARAIDERKKLRNWLLSLPTRRDPAEEITYLAERLGLVREEEGSMTWSCKYYADQLVPWLQNGSGSLRFQTPPRLLYIVDDDHLRIRDWIAARPSDIVAFDWSDSQSLAWNQNSAKLRLEEIAKLRMETGASLDILPYLDLVAKISPNDDTSTAKIIDWEGSRRALDAGIQLAAALDTIQGILPSEVYSSKWDQFNEAVMSLTQRGLRWWESIWRRRLLSGRLTIFLGEPSLPPPVPA